MLTNKNKIIVEFSLLVILNTFFAYENYINCIFLVLILGMSVSRYHYTYNIQSWEFKLDVAALVMLIGALEKTASTIAFLESSDLLRYLVIGAILLIKLLSMKPLRVKIGTFLGKKN